METKQAILPLSAPVSTSILLCFGNRHNHITVGDETIFVSSMTLYPQAVQLYIQYAALASNGPVYTRPLALQELVGQHPKPFERAAPAGRSTSAVSILLISTKCFPAAYIFVTPRKHTILPSSAKWSPIHRQYKAPRPRQRTSEGFSCCSWVIFPCRGSIRALTAPAGVSCTVQNKRPLHFCNDLLKPGGVTLPASPNNG